MFAVMAEERYPGDFFPRDPYNLTEERKEYNLKVVQWRKNRREIKGLASEALLLSSNSKLREKLLNFMQNDNPEFKLTDIEKLMKEEIKSE